MGADESLCHWEDLGRRSRSAGFVGVGDAGLVCDPVGFPGCAAVIGEGLLEVGGVSVQIGPAKTDEDGFVIDSVLSVLSQKFADSVFEFADLRRSRTPTFWLAQ